MGEWMNEWMNEWVNIFNFRPTEDVLTVVEDGTSISPEYLHNNGFDRPIIIKEKSGLGIKVPPSNFTIYDVEKRVGKNDYLYLCIVYDGIKAVFHLW